MKYFKFIFSAVLLLASVACSKPALVEEGDLIVLTPSVGTFETKSMSDYAKGDKGEINSETDMRTGWIGFVGYNVSNHTAVWGNGGRGASVAWKNNAWATRDGVAQYKWSQLGAEGNRAIDIFAYFPLDTDNSINYSTKDNISTPVLKVFNWLDGEDVMWARTLDQEPVAAVPLHFYHAFAKLESVNFKIPEDSPLTFHIKQVELMGTHCETGGAEGVGGKMVIPREGDAYMVNGSVQQTRCVTLADEIKINKNRVQAAVSTNGYIQLVKKADNAFFFPVTNTDDFWDLNAPAAAGTALSKVCLHLKAKVKQGEETVLQGSGEYVIGSETQYGDIYIPLKSSANPNQTFLAGHRYTVNVFIKKGVGYNKDGKEYDPILLSVEIDDWTENELSVGQITVSANDITLDASHSSASLIVNTDHTNLSMLTAEVSDNLKDSLQTSFEVVNGKVRLTVSKKAGAVAGTGTVIINDQKSNSMATINVTIQ